MCLLETDQRHVVVSSEFFRANVGVVLTRPDRRVLVFERIDKPGEWQLPQGGLDEGEEPAVAALRELHEETGIGSELVDPIAEHPCWLAYELPPDRRRRKSGRGQVQKWFLFEFLGDDDAIDLVPSGGQRPEFSAFRWVAMGELVETVWDVRRPIYRALLHEWSDLLRS